jgi:cell wall-associated NlpC family hydrolase
MRFYAKGAMSFFLLSLLVVAAALAQESPHKTTAPRPLTRHEGLAIVHTALHSGRREADCSHLIHALYERAGFPYDYAPSSDLYAGTEEFRRVTNPQPGDLTVWRGHAGIAVNPARHSFFSMLSTGPGVDSWDSPYWKQRGQPHFFRYLKQAPSGALSGSMRTTTLKP